MATSRTQPRPINHQVLDAKDRINTKMKRIPVLSTLFQIRSREIRMLEKEHKMESTTRGYKMYNAGFQPLLGRSIIDQLAVLARIRKKPLRITDDGAGEGVFLDELKSALGRRKIPSITTAVTLTKNQALEERLKTNQIDYAHYGSAELYVPNEMQDAIFSYGGSIHYTLEQFRKDLVLKYIHSLNVHGFACIAFDFKYFVGFPKNLDPNKFIEEIKRALEKRGFVAEYHHLKWQSPWTKIAPDYLIITRVR